jgi:hypothetical protein
VSWIKGTKLFIFFWLILGRWLELLIAPRKNGAGFAVGLLPAHFAHTQDTTAAYSFFVEHQRGQKKL